MSTSVYIGSETTRWNFIHQLLYRVQICSPKWEWEWSLSLPPFELSQFSLSLDWLNQFLSRVQSRRIRKNCYHFKRCAHQLLRYFLWHVNPCIFTDDDIVMALQPKMSVPRFIQISDKFSEDVWVYSWTASEYAVKSEFWERNDEGYGEGLREDRDVPFLPPKSSSHRTRSACLRSGTRQGKLAPSLCPLTPAVGMLNF